MTSDLEEPWRISSQVGQSQQKLGMRMRLVEIIIERVVHQFPGSLPLPNPAANTAVTGLWDTWTSKPRSCPTAISFQPQFYPWAGKPDDSCLKKLSSCLERKEFWMQALPQYTPPPPGIWESPA